MYESHIILVIILIIIVILRAVLFNQYWNSADIVKPIAYCNIVTMIQGLNWKDRYPAFKNSKLKRSNYNVFTFQKDGNGISL